MISPDSIIQVRADPLPDEVPRLLSLDESLICVHARQVRQRVPLGYALAPGLAERPSSLFNRRCMTRSDMVASGLMKILSTSGPYACRARMVLRKRDDDKLE